MNRKAVVERPNPVAAYLQSGSGGAMDQQDKKMVLVILIMISSSHSTPLLLVSFSFLKAGKYAERVGVGAPVYLAAVLEYLATKVLED
ncbi:hypothetical protein L6452_22196 [Arctium lappa]|uniref:Uncharacterized protein n=1 Tax=Arctium lappa TaxID=4217 RepID=A0ACB9B017_ARCLA|nr:hypothetical protein L6452_22196 [Arctium lappa]